VSGAPNLLELPAWFHLAATFVFAVTGAIAALRRHYDVVGVFALALVTGVGGALLRDGLFLQQGPPLVLTDWRYLPVIGAGCAVGYVFGARLDRFNLAFSVIDALGLAAYGAIGARLSLAAGLSAPAAIFVGVVNATGGGAVRDILTREEPLMFKAGQFYVLATVSGTALFVLLLRQFQLGAEAAAVWGVGATFVLRILAIQYDWRTSPLRWETEPTPAGPGANQSDPRP
jgi:uncharacterized membrane protein YeiH